MAKTVTVTMTDDLDGSANAEPIDFSYKGVSYRIDLGKKNAAALEKLLKPYIAAAARVSGRAAKASTPRRGRASGKVSEDVAAIRAWATDNGHAVNSRGRISQAVREAYAAAH